MLRDESKHRRRQYLRTDAHFLTQSRTLAEMAEYKLTYFPIRVKAESVRLAFSAAGVNFEDNRISREQWPSFKASKY